MNDDLNGIFFNSGMQGIGSVTEDGDFFVVTGLLQIVVIRSDDGKPAVSFQHLTPFVDESTIGVDTRVPKCGAFLYKLSSDIKDAYYQSTNRIQPISAGALAQLRGR